MTKEGRFKLGQVVERVQSLSARGKCEKDACNLEEQGQHIAQAIYLEIRGWEAFGLLIGGWSFSLQREFTTRIVPTLGLKRHLWVSLLKCCPLSCYKYVY